MSERNILIKTIDKLYGLPEVKLVLEKTSTEDLEKLYQRLNQIFPIKKIS